MPRTLDYAPPAHRRRLPRWARWSIGISLLVLTLALLIPLPVRRVTTSVNPTTGTVVRQTGARVVTILSPLEARLAAAGIPWTARPRFLGETSYDIFGQSQGRACASAPPIYQLRPLLKEFAAASTDAELRSFVRVMETGTDAEQRAAVDAASEKALAAMGAKLP